MLKSHFNISQSNDEEEEEEEEDDDDEPKAPARPPPAAEVRIAKEMAVAEPLDLPKLLRGQVSQRLGFVGKTAEGDGYAYLKASCVSMGLRQIEALTYFKHLQFVDVSDNRLTIKAMQCLAQLPYLLLLHADQNLADSAVFKHMKYLQVMIMNNNKITEVYEVYQPNLSTLELGINQITSLDFCDNMESLKCLDLRMNLLKGIKELNLPNLDSLYLAANKIKSVNGIDRLVNLRILHLRDNPLKNLDGFGASNEKLKYINLRNCKTRSLTQIRKLMPLPKLETLVAKGTPYMGGPEDAGGGEEDEAEQRIEILASLPRLVRINKGEVTEEEREEAQEMMLQWLEEGYKEEVEEETQGEGEGEALGEQLQGEEGGDDE